MNAIAAAFEAIIASATLLVQRNDDARRAAVQRDARRDIRRRGKDPDAAPVDGAGEDDVHRCSGLYDLSVPLRVHDERRGRRRESPGLAVREIGTATGSFVPRSSPWVGTTGAEMFRSCSDAGPPGNR
jgi:hypothetical protein